MERTTTTDAFMRGFYKAAYDAGLTPDQAAEMHAVAIINEARFRSPDFARGFDKVAGAYPWYDPRRWVGMQPAPTHVPSTMPFDSSLLSTRRWQTPQPVKHPVSPDIPTHASAEAQDFFTRVGLPEDPEALNGLANGIRDSERHKSIPEHNAKVTAPTNPTPTPVTSTTPKTKSLPSDNLGALLKPGAGAEMDFKVRTPSGIIGARG